jgi:Tol biopolymer transport system component
MKYGKILVTLTLVAAANALATWYMVGAGTFSADGSKVAYLSNDVYQGSTVSFVIYTVNADGSAKVRFDLKEGVWGAPHFSPDGKKVAFITDDEFLNGNIFLADVDGENLRRLTNYGDDPYEKEYEPEVKRTGVLDEGLTFSPDGRRILYCSAEFGSSDIFAINIDGTGKTRLTAFAGYDESGPVFLPGGEEMLFTATGSGEEAGIWIMNADGTGKRRLYCGEDVKLVAVSPDGKKRAYEKHLGLDLDYRSYRFITYVADLEGSSRFKLAEMGYSGEGPAEGVDLEFSPDGKKVLYCLDDVVYVVNADGSARKNLTPAWDYVESAAFFAEGAKIVFVGRRYPYPDRTNFWTMDADGSHLELFKATEGMYVSDVVVSPTGDRFIFNGDYEDYEGDAPVDYFVVNADGSGLTRLSEYNPPPYEETEE